MFAYHLVYTVQNDGFCNTVTVYDTNSEFFTIECFVDSPFTIEEEIQNWLDDNGYDDDNYEFTKINPETPTTIDGVTFKMNLYLFSGWVEVGMCQIAEIEDANEKKHLVRYDGLENKFDLIQY